MSFERLTSRYPLPMEDGICRAFIKIRSVDEFEVIILRITEGCVGSPQELVAHAGKGAVDKAVPPMLGVVSEISFAVPDGIEVLPVERHLGGQVRSMDHHIRLTRHLPPLVCDSFRGNVQDLLAVVICYNDRPI